MTTQNNTLLELKEIYKSFGGRTVLQDVSLMVGEQEIVTLIGPNGAGKSTLMKIALGLTAPDKGRVMRKKGLVIGYMPQKLSIDETLPLLVEDFLQLRPGVTGGEVDEILEVVRLTRFRKSPVQMLSGGEMQRLLMGRALLGRPDLLVLDEPVQGIDIAGQEEIYRLIRKTRDERKCSVLMISHDLHMVMSATDRVICLNQHICCQGAPESVRENPDYHALFTTGAENITMYTHHHDHHHDAQGNIVPGPHHGKGCDHD
ncbi:zinc ABC transporter ATP-binding protein ZnuC [Emcibacter sp.]|uniref:zinc ABC transporter ATP-binding protein ZnuC n=1 Tax=Emcibacter sp. TaxID=1979954 RepID=UPI002AA8D30B|nr:zinc ABC transporter ATP-binding protein ZnuC [Emcibacter sp.]